MTVKSSLFSIMTVLTTTVVDQSQKYTSLKRGYKITKPVKRIDCEQPAAVHQLLEKGLLSKSKACGERQLQSITIGRPAHSIQKRSLLELFGYPLYFALPWTEPFYDKNYKQKKHLNHKTNPKKSPNAYNFNSTITKRSTAKKSRHKKTFTNVRTTTSKRPTTTTKKKRTTTTAIPITAYQNLRQSYDSIDPLRSL